MSDYPGLNAIANGLKAIAEAQENANQLKALELLWGQASGPFAAEEVKSKLKKMAGLEP